MINFRVKKWLSMAQVLVHFIQTYLQNICNKKARESLEEGRILGKK